MLAFKDDNVVSKYSVELTDMYASVDLVDEMLHQVKKTRDDNFGPIFVNHGEFNPERVKLIEGGLEHTKSCPYQHTLAGYTHGTIYTTRMVYSAPYTLALAAQSLTFGPYDYSFMLKERHLEENLIDVAHGVNLDGLNQLLACFNNDIDALNYFLTTYHPDLYYLRRYLEMIKLNKVDEYPIDYETEDKRLFREQQTASLNTEVARKLNLSFKGRN